MSGPNDGPDASGFSITDLIKLFGAGVSGVTAAVEHALHAAEIVRIQADPSSVAKPGEHVDIAKPTKRGLVVPLTAQQRVNRMLYLAQQLEILRLDDYVRIAGAPLSCPDLYYLLKDHNGGKDPTASDPADRWSAPGNAFVNRTVDCIGGMCWCGGWDRYQPTRFGHLYGGWINTDSMIMECDRVEKGFHPEIPACFHRIPYPTSGCYVVCRSGSPGHTIGHIGGCVEVPPGLDLSQRENWKKIKVVDTASRTPAKANAMTTANGWFGTGAYFVEPVMQP